MKNLKSFASNFDKQKVIKKIVHAWYINKVFIISLFFFIFFRMIRKMHVNFNPKFYEQ